MNFNQDCDLSKRVWQIRRAVGVYAKNDHYEIKQNEENYEYLRWREKMNGEKINGKINTL